MDLKITSTNFQGKKEILYGLTKAADNVHSYSMYNQPRLLRFGENKKSELYKIAAKTYLDMVTKDSEFVKTINSVTQKELIHIKSFLETQSNGVKPFEHFKILLNDVMNRNGFNSATKKNAERTLLEKLS